MSFKIKYRWPTNDYKLLFPENRSRVRLEKSKHCEESDIVEEATSRKCEEQLSWIKANSCSSFIAPNRTTEMEQEDNNSCWNNLPSVILQEIFSYLPHENRIRASQVCKNWRYALFHPSFWKKINFVLKDEDSISWARFLADRFGLSLHEATIRCDIICYATDLSTLLKKLSSNRQLRKLSLKYSSNIFRCPHFYVKNEDDRLINGASLMDSIVKIIETSNRLEALSLGCIEELAANANIILEPLLLHHAKHLTHLSLASIKDDPDHYELIELEKYVFKSFIRLTVLTLDYDVVNDALLRSLDSGTMERLVIHVHGWRHDYRGTTNAAWETFVRNNPRCELRLSLIHSYMGVEVLDMHILRPAMPLTHLKILFCETFNIEVLHRLSSWYPPTLKSLIWIDSMDTRINTTRTIRASNSNEPDIPDPLVLVAWRCTKLVEVMFIGHRYDQENLLAIARLRGSTLKLLVFAASDIRYEIGSWHKTMTITEEIEKIMGKQWAPLKDNKLPAVVLDSFDGDSREIIMPFVLHDQK